MIRLTVPLPKGANNPRITQIENSADGTELLLAGEITVANRGSLKKEFSLFALYTPITDQMKPVPITLRQAKFACLLDTQRTLLTTSGIQDQVLTLTPFEGSDIFAQEQMQYAGIHFESDELGTPSAALSLLNSKRFVVQWSHTVAIFDRAQKLHYYKDFRPICVQTFMDNVVNLYWVNSYCLYIITNPMLSSQESSDFDEEKSDTNNAQIAPGATNLTIWRLMISPNQPENGWNCAEITSMFGSDIQNFSLHPAGNLGCYSTKQEGVLFELKEGKITRLKAGLKPVRGIEWSPNGERSLLIHQDSVSIYTLNQPKWYEYPSVTPITGTIQKVQFSKDNQWWGYTAQHETNKQLETLVHLKSLQYRAQPQLKKPMQFIRTRGLSSLNLQYLEQRSKEVELNPYFMPEDHPGWKPFHFIVVNGSRFEIEKALKEVADAKELLALKTEEEGYTPLHLAARYREVKLVVYLLEQGADYEAKDNYHRTPGELALEIVDTERRNALLARLPRLDRRYPDYPALYFLLKDKWLSEESIITLLNTYYLNRLNEITQPYSKLNNETPLLWAAQFGRAATANHFFKLIKDSEQLLYPNNKGNTPLHWAAQYNQVAIFEVYFKSGLFNPEQLIRQTNKGNTPLHWVAKNGQLAIAELYFKSELFKPEQLLIPDSQGYTPLHVAAKNNQTSIVALYFKSGFKPEQLLCLNKKNNTTPLHWGAKNGQLGIVELYFKSGLFKPEQLLPSDNQGNTPIHWAARYGQTNIIELYFKKSELFKPEQLFNSDSKGNTPLHLAAREGYLETVKFLLETGKFSTINQPNKEGKTARDIAKNEMVIKLISSYQKPDSNLSPSEKNKKENLKELIVTIQHGCIKELKKEIDYFSLVVLFGNELIVDIFTPLLSSSLKSTSELVLSLDKNNSTPIHWAAQYGQTAIIDLYFKLFKSHPKQLLCLDNQGNSPLHIAVQYDQTDVIELYFSSELFKPEQLRQANRGNTLLHLAAKAGKLKTVRFLLETGQFDVNQSNNERKTALDVAENEDIKKLISEYKTTKYSSTPTPTLFVSSTSKQTQPISNNNMIIILPNEREENTANSM